MKNLMKIFFIVMMIIFGLCILSVIELKSYFKEHDKWIKTIKAPSEGRLILEREKPFCKIDSVMGDSVRIITVVHRKNIYKK